MKRRGNAISNRTYNPQNRKPQIPLDVDEVDTALEKFIRQKYDQQTFSSGAARAAVRHDTGSTRSSDDQPPPLPPKPGKRFGFGLRSVSSALPLGRFRQITPPDSSDGWKEYDAPSPIRVNKQSRVFGASVGGTNGEDLELKVATLRDMGFPDDKRNASILKGLGGNLERTIEALIRLGEGSAPNSRSRTPAQTRNVAVSQPLPLEQALQPTQEINGAPLVRDAFERPSQASPQSQMLSQGTSTGGQLNRSFSPPFTQSSNRSFSPSNPLHPRPYNPFEASTAPSSATFQLENAFDSMHVSQPLFPNATGGYPQPQHHVQDIRTQHSMTPPVPQVPQQYYQYNQQPQQSHLPSESYNPFMRSQQQEPQLSMNPYTSAAQPNITSSNPLMNAQSTVSQSPFDNYASQQLQQNSHQPQQQHSQAFLPQASQQQSLSPQNFTPQSTNPYMLQQPQANQASSQSSQDQHYNQIPSQPLQAPHTGRFDKASILALYNYPQFAPAPLRNISEDTTPQSPSNSELPVSQYPAGFQAKQGQRSATMPAQMVSGSRNPFQSATTTNPEAPVAPSPSVNAIGMSRHVSQESVDIGGYQSGRHSPDAFASLSARYVR